MNRKAIIFGIKGHKLTRSEKNLFKKIKPWGIILFSRNVKNLLQLRKLINELKNAFDDEKYPILIDQEGGKVSRLNNIIDLSIFSQDFFNKLYSKDKNLFHIYYKIYVDKVCDIFRDVGININTVPVLDVMRVYTHNVIGNRSFSFNSRRVSKLGNFCIDYFKKNKIGTVIKHIPGHGLSKSDSHYKTPLIKNSKRELIKVDFKPFKSCKSDFAMTAHVIYSKYDPNNVATQSKLVINNIIRNHINFKGLLISDDISMESLKYNLLENASKALRAGCNLILHCNGNLKEMSELAKVIPNIDKFTKKKTSQFYKFLG